MDLQSQYQEIQNSLEASHDFSTDLLIRSRELFEIGSNEVVPRKFEVWTTLAGLPIPTVLTDKFQDIVTRIKAIVPATTLSYWVKPANYHWELFIIKRQNEEISPLDLEQTPALLKEILADLEPFSLAYQGFVITEDGTVIVKGYGEFDLLREKLRQLIPWASAFQSQLGHISLGRILDPIGEENFATLKKLVQASSNEYYGEFQVPLIKLVHERRYMEQYEIIASFPLSKA